MSEEKYRIVGSVISSSTRQGVAGARVEAWDKDLHVNDLIGSAVTGEDGFFVIEFDSSYYRELFADRIGVKLTHIPYKGTPQAFQDVVGGQVAFMFDQLTAGLPLVMKDRGCVTVICCPAPFLFHPTSVT